jgi:hypothetical protein
MTLARRLMILLSIRKRREQGRRKYENAGD